MNVAIIPARGGSKRIPQKNIKPFCGKPMIAWSIETALASGCFDRVIVSTDDAQIAALAERWGAESPFLRPQELADDHTPTRPVINHAIGEVAQRYAMPQFVCCIYATAPFLQVEDLRRGLALLIEQERDFAFSVGEFGYPIQRALKMTPEGGVEMLYPQYRTTRSQDLEQAYHDAGQFYWGRTQAFLANRPTFSPASAPVVLPAHRVQDIDTPEDWQRAELMFRALQLDNE